MLKEKEVVSLQEHKVYQELVCRDLNEKWCPRSKTTDPCGPVRKKNVGRNTRKCIGASFIIITTVTNGSLWIQ